MKLARLLVLVLVVLVFSVSIVFADTVEITPENPNEDQELRCNVNTGMDRHYYDYQWYNNGQRDRSTGTHDWIYPRINTDIGDEVSCFVFAPMNLFIGSDVVTIEENPASLGPLPEVNLPPTVEILSPSNNQLYNLGEILFFNASVNDPEGDDLTYNWDLGNGEVRTQPGTLYAYTQPGNYFVTLTVSDGENVVSDRIRIHIRENDDPVAIARANATVVEVGEAIRFDSSESFDPDGFIIWRSWNFGDEGRAIGRSPVFSFDYPGTYEVTLTVYDNFINSDTDSLVIVVEDRGEPPVADAGPDRTVYVGEEMDFDGSGSYDPEGEIVEYVWDFDDGDRDRGVDAEHSYSLPGTYEVVLEVEDDDGNTDTDRAIITVLDFARPIAVIDSNYSRTFLGFPISFSGVNSYDPDGTVVSYFWDFGDGSSGNGVDVEHVFTDGDSFVVTLTVTDNDGYSGSTSITIDGESVRRGPGDGARRSSDPGSMQIRDFRISGVTAHNYQPYYRRGDSITLFVKLTNEGSYDEECDLRVRVPEFYGADLISNIELDVSQVKWVTTSVNIPSNAATGVHVVRIELLPEEGDSGDIGDISYWPFVVAY